MAVHDTEENSRSKYTKECLGSLLDTVDFGKHRIIISDNGSCQETHEIYRGFLSRSNYNENIKFNFNIDNLGTAKAVNLGLRTRLYNEVCTKCDNDIVVHQSGWVEELEQVFIDNPEIGICGLKRDDVYGDFTKNGKLLMSDDVMGTCTALNPRLLDAIGYYNQFSVYGYDDVIFSARSLAAGFKNCFLPHIKITHLDEGGTEYTEWKKQEAQQYLQEVGLLCDAYRQGKAPIYYDGGFGK